MPFAPEPPPSSFVPNIVLVFVSTFETLPEIFGASFDKHILTYFVFYH